MSMMRFCIALIALVSGIVIGASFMAEVNEHHHIQTVHRAMAPNELSNNDIPGGSVRTALVHVDMLLALRLRSQSGAGNNSLSNSDVNVFCGLLAMVLLAVFFAQKTATYFRTTADNPRGRMLSFNLALLRAGPCF